MKHLLPTTLAAVLLVGGGEAKQSATPEAQPVEPVAEVQLVEPVAEAAQPEPPLVKLEAPDISIHEAIKEGDIEAVKQHLATGTDVNAKDNNGQTPLYHAARHGQDLIVELLIAKGADVNVKDGGGDTPLDKAKQHSETADLLRKNGGKTGEELKAEGK